MSGAYFNFKNPIWRVNPDGEVRDSFKLLTDVFEMEEEEFFSFYNKAKETKVENTYLREWTDEIKRVWDAIPELPLSNIWMAKQTEPRLPENSVLHLGILNSLRSWSLFDTPMSVYSYSNVGGFGIDGCLSTCIGASIAEPDKLFFCVLGDLATFYDLNVLGNRHIGNNIRIIVSNNGTGYEMHCPNSNGLTLGTEEADKFFCAGGHNGNKSHNVLRHFAQDLGFEYLKADTKEEYLSHLNHFLTSDKLEKPILFEVFVDAKDDDIAYKATKITFTSSTTAAKKKIRKIIGDNGVAKLKTVLKK